MPRIPRVHYGSQREHLPRVASSLDVETFGWLSVQVGDEFELVIELEEALVIL